MLYCTKCEDELPGDGSYVYCHGCKGKTHFQCTSIKESTYAAMSRARKEQWRCEFCRLANKISKKIPMPSGDSDATAALNEIRDSFKDLSQKLKECIAAQLSVSEQVEIVRNKQSQLIEKTNALESKVSEITSLINQKDKKIDELSIQCHRLEQESRSREIVIYGVHKAVNESIFDIVSRIGKKLQVQVEPIHIEAAYRMQRGSNARSGGANQDVSRPLRISVSFASLVKRNEFLKNKKGVKITNADIIENGPEGNVYINEMMSAYFKNLWWETRNQARATGWKYIWFSGGKIKAKKQEGEKIVVIGTVDDVHKLI